MSYEDAYRSQAARQPVKHRLRRVEFKLREAVNRQKLARFKRDAGEFCSGSILSLPDYLRPPSHKYQGYKGPWIEDYFYKFWVNNRIQSDVVYVPVFWTDIFLHSQILNYSPAEYERNLETIWTILAQEIRPDEIFFTVLEYDHPIWDWHKFPKNVLVFSAGGNGDIPIPLLKGSPPFSCPRKDIPVSFMGRIGGASNSGNVRQRMYESLKDYAYFGEGADWRSIMERSTFTLCPRGLGRASFRLYEAISVGSIPIYIWDDFEWLPYNDKIDWSEIGISVNVSRISEIPAMIESHSAAEIELKQSRMAELYPKYFTLEAVCENITRMLSEFKSLKDVLAITNQRIYS